MYMAFNLADHCFNPSRPFRNCAGCNCPDICLLRAVKPDISEVGGDIERRVITGKLVNAESRVVTLQQAIDFRSHPAQFTKFKGITMLARQNFQQAFQPLKIQLPLRRKLKQNRPKLFPQMLSAGKKVVKCVFRIFEFFIVRNKSAGFYRENKIFRRASRQASKASIVGRR